MRADLYVSKKLNISQSRAADLIKRGFVLLDGTPITDCSKDIKSEPEVSVAEIKHLDKVSRGYDKIEFGCNYFKLNPLGAVCLDAGSSTGGFTQYLLDHGAQTVVAVDVGSMQMHEKLRLDSRVELHENTDIRDFVSEDKYDIIVADISFMPIRLAIPKFLSLSHKNTKMLLLFKPQFEVGKSINKTGVVKDSIAMNEVLDETLKLLPLGTKNIKSDIKGGDGNTEYFLFVDGV